MNKTSILLAAVWLALAGCGDPKDGDDTSTGADDSGATSDLEDGQCREDGDCTGEFEECWPQGGSWCGDCQDPESTCVEGEACEEEGEVCTPRTLDCPCGSDDVEWTCQTSCVEAGCDWAEACNSETGLCETVHCDDGTVCPDHHSCDSATGGTGCVRDTCSTDTDCTTAGYCVEGACHAEPGFCDDGPE